MKNHTILPFVRIHFNQVRNVFSKAVILILFLLGINQAKAQTPNFTCSVIGSPSLDICRGGIAKVQLYANSTISFPIQITVNSITSYHYMDSLTAKIGTTTMTVSQTTGHVYTIHSTSSYTQINAGSSIYLDIWIRPNCGIISNTINVPFTDFASRTISLTVQKGANTQTLSATFNGATINYPSIHVSPSYNYADTIFRIAFRDLCMGCTTPTAACTSPIIYNYATPPTLFYRKVSVTNSNSGSTLLLDQPHTFLKVEETFGSTIKYWVRAIHYKDNTGSWHRIQRTGFPSSSPNPVFSPNATQTIRIDSSYSFSQYHYQYKFDSALVTLLTGGSFIDNTTQLEFWIEGEVIYSGTSSVCGTGSKIDLGYLYNCATDTTSTCLTNLSSTNHCLYIQPFSPRIKVKASGIGHQDVCYNYQNPASPHFNQHQSIYYFVLQNVGSDTARNITTDFFYRFIGAPDRNTHYLLGAGQVLAATYDTSWNAATWGSGIGTSFILPSLHLQDTLTYHTHFDTTKLTTGFGPLTGNFHSLDSFQTTSSGLPVALAPNKTMVLIWKGYTQLPTKDCTPIEKDPFNYLVKYYSPCTGGDTMIGKYYNEISGGYKVVSANLIVNTSVSQVLGPGLSQVIGATNEDYRAAPVGTIAYTIPDFNVAPITLPSDIPANQAVIIRLRLGSMLNIWKGDFHNRNHLCSYDSSAYYNPNHLNTAIRFITKYNDTIHPSGIAYVKNCDNSFCNYYTNTTTLRHLPTGLNDSTDVIEAIFKFNSSFNLDSISGLTVEADVQPVCGSCSCTSHVHDANVTTSSTPISISVYHVPSLLCDTFKIGDTAVAALTVASTTNKYSIFCQDDVVLVQCPGCKIAGMYGIKMLASRINFGLEDANNDNRADAPLKAVLFDQLNFKPIFYSSPIHKVQNNKLLYHDLLRLRLNTIVHLDNPVGSDYFPTATKLGLFQSTAHIHEKGFLLGYVHVVPTPDSIEVYNLFCDTANAGRNIQTNIPALVVWISDGDSVYNSGYPYHSGFKAFGQPSSTGYPSYKYVSPYQTDSAMISPIAVYFNPALDYTYINVFGHKEFVYDISYSRMNTLYLLQYGVSLPFDCYHDKLKFSFDINYRVAVKYPVIPGTDFTRKYDVVANAYFTKIPETATNRSHFVDLQDAADTMLFSFFSDSLSHAFVGTPSLLENLCPIDSAVSPIPIVNSIPVGSCDSIRWWCVKGESFLKVAGFEFQPQTFDYTRNYCQLNLGTLGANPTWKFSVSSAFNYEYRHFARAKSITVSGLNSSAVQSNLAASFNVGTTSFSPAVLNSSNVYYNTLTQTWFSDLNGMYCPIQTITAPNNKLFPYDDNYGNGNGTDFRLRFDLHQCDSIPGDSCLVVRVVSEFYIADLDSAIGNRNIDSSCFLPALTVNANNSCDSMLPFKRHLFGAFNQRYDDQRLAFESVGKNHLTASALTGDMENGRICWNNIQVKNDSSFLNGHKYAPGAGLNPWVCITFPPKWGNTNPIDSVRLNGIKLIRHLVPPIANPPSVPTGSLTYLYWLPTTTSTQTNYLNYYHTSPTTTFLNKIQICAKYPCDSNFIAADSARLFVGVQCDTSLYPFDTSFAILASNSCDRIRYPLGLKTSLPLFEVNNMSSYQQPGVCADFNMAFNIANTQYDTLYNIKVLTKLPSGGLYTFTSPTPPLATCPTCNTSTTNNSTVTGDTMLNNSPLVLPIGYIPGWSNTGVSNIWSKVTFGLETHCTLSYDPKDEVKIKFYADRHCNTQVFTDSILFSINPVLDNPNSVFNQFAAKDTVISVITGCANSDTLFVNLLNLLTGANTSHSIGDTLMNGYNQLLLQVPAGYSVDSAFWNGIKLPVDTVASGSACDSTGHDIFGANSGGQKYMLIDLDTLKGINLDSLMFPINVLLHPNAFAHCLDSIKVIVATADTFSCGGSSTCIICAAQDTVAAKSILFIVVPPPSLSISNIPCSGTASIGAFGCGQHHWTVSPSVAYTVTSPNTILIGTTGNYTVAVQDTLLPGSRCVSDTAMSAPIHISNGVIFTTSVNNVSCGSVNNGAIGINISQGVPLFHLTLFNGYTTTSVNTSGSYYLWNGLPTGNYIISVTDINGCVAHDTVVITGSAICGQNVACEGASYAYSLTTPPVGSAAFHWNVANGTILSTANLATVTWGSAGTGIVTVIALNATSVPIDTFSLSVVIIPIPHPLIGADSTVSCFVYQPGIHPIMPIPPSVDTCFQICDSTIIHFETAFFAGHSYNWSVSSGTLISGQGTSGIDVMFSTAGDASVTVTETDTSNIAGCSGTFIRCIKVIQRPHAIFSSSTPPIGGVIHICNNTTPLTFTDHSTPAGGIMNWVWDFGDGQTASGNTVVNHHYLPGVYTLVLTVENACHCSDTANIRIIVDSLPGPDIFCVSTVCHNDTAIYSTSAYCTGIIYHWGINSAGTIVSGTGTNQIKVLWGNGNSGAGVVSLQVLNCAAYCNIPTFVSVPIVASNDSIVGAKAVCSPDLVSYQISSTQGTNYNWQVISGGAILITDSTQSTVWVHVNGAAGTTFTLVVSYSNCALHNCGGSDTLVVHITGKFDIVCQSGSSCKRACVNDTSIYTTTSPSSVFNWNLYSAGNPGVQVTGVAAATGSSTYTIDWSAITPAITIPTQFTVVAHDASGVNFCNHQDPVYIITVYPLPPKPVSTAISLPSCICPSSSALMYAVPTSPNYLLQWNVLTTGAIPASTSGNTFTPILTTLPADITLQQMMIAEPYCMSDTTLFHITACVMPNDSISGDDTVCINSIHYYTMNNGFSYYNWGLVNNAGGSIVSGQGTSTVGIQWNSPAANTNYGLVCNHTFCNSTVATPTYNVQVIIPQPIAISTITAVYCTGQPDSFKVTGGGGTPCSLSGNYIWDFGDGSPLVTTATIVATHFFAKSGTYTIHVFAENSTTNNLLQNATTTITVAESPQVVIQNTGGGCPNYNLAANVSNAAGLGTLSYQWQYSSSCVGYANISGATGSSYSATLGQGCYNVIISNSVNSCTSLANTNINCTTGSGGIGGSGTTYCNANVTGTISTSISNCATVTFSASTSGTFTHYTWFFGDGGSSALTSSTVSAINHIYTHAGVYHVQLALFNSSGCQSILTTIVTINIVADYKISTTCLTGGSPSSTINTVFHDNSSAIHLPYTIAWTGTFTGSSNPLTTSPTAGSTVNETITVTDAASNVCAYSFSFTAPSLPTVAFTANPASPICTGFPVVFTPALTPGTTVVAGWDWSFTDKAFPSPLHKFNSNLQSPTESFQYDGLSSPQGKVLINPTLTDERGCLVSTSSNYFVKDNFIKGFISSITPAIGCLNSSGVNVTAIVANFPSPQYFPYTYSWYAGPTNTVSSATNTTTYTNPGVFYVAITDNYQCSDIASFATNLISMPPLVVTGNKKVCRGTPLNLGFYAGAQYNYSWSIVNSLSSSVASGTTSAINVGGASMNSATSPYILTSTISNPATPYCPVTITDTIVIYPLPGVITSTNPSSYCLANSPVILHDSAVGGLSPYAYHWSVMAGNTPDITVTTGGAYWSYVMDAHGCTSPNTYVSLVRSPDFSGLPTGCLSFCDTGKICAVHSSNYPISNWLLNGVPVPPYMIASDGSLIPASSGHYQQVLCSTSGCCDTSDVLDITVCDSISCCSEDHGYIDTIICLGMDSLGFRQYSYSLHFFHGCIFGDSVSITTSNGVLNYYPSYVLPGWNVINGSYTTDTTATLCLTVEVGGTDSSCVIAIPCKTLPGCLDAAPCDLTLVADSIVCNGLDGLGHPMYSIYINATNMGNAGSSITLAPTHGIITGGIPAVIPNGSSQFVLSYTDLPVYNSYVCFAMTMTDTFGLTCTGSLCTLLPDCFTDIGCKMDACVKQVFCIGSDSAGHPMYAVQIDYVNGLAAVSPDIVISIFSPTGAISSIVPSTPTSTTTNSVWCTYTDLSGLGSACFNIILTDTGKGLVCMALYNNYPCLCTTLPDCSSLDDCNLHMSVVGVKCLGVDIFGNQIYQVQFHVHNPLAVSLTTLSSYSPDGSTSLSGISLVAYASGSFTVFFTNTAHVSTTTITITFIDGNGHLCHQTAKISLPHCDDGTDDGGGGDDNRIAAVPNPNNGKPVIYYRYVVSENEQWIPGNLQVTVLESGTGRLISSLRPTSPAGQLNWQGTPLPTGHYFVVLWMNGKIVAVQMLEVVKE